MLECLDEWVEESNSVRVVDCFVDGLDLADLGVDGSKFKAVNNRDKNFTQTKMERRMAQIEESVARYQQLDSADRQEPSEVLIGAGSRRRSAR